MERTEQGGEESEGDALKRDTNVAHVVWSYASSDREDDDGAEMVAIFDGRISAWICAKWVGTRRHPARAFEWEIDHVYWEEGYVTR